jgi:methionyl-tRNA formyltransferase
MSSAPLRIAFMGSPEIAVTVLEALLAAGHDVVAVYSQPPRVAGRGKKLRPTPVHAFADDRGLEVRTPNSLRNADAQAAFDALALDAAVVVAYGLILPQAVLDAPRLGCLNMHASCLPRWRGAAPIQRAIMAGDSETGVDAMLMEAGLDTGPVLASARTAIGPGDTAGSVHDRLAELAAELAPRALAGLADGSLTPKPQPDTGETYAHKLSAADQAIDWTRGAAEIDAQIRGLSPAPGAYCHWAETEAAAPVRLKLLLSEQASGEAGAAPGTVLSDDLRVACGDDGRAVRLLRLQKPGGKPMDAVDFLRGTVIEPGQRLQSVPYIRRAEAADFDRIIAVTDLAFGQDLEGRVIRQLVADNEDMLSLVTVLNGEIVGHIQFYPVWVDGAKRACGLGPVSVVPALQKTGLGSAMIREGIGILRRRKACQIMFLLGHAEYYPRFGFKPEIGAQFDSPWESPNFMAKPLRDGAPEAGTLTFPAAFDQS